jgi:hypothetical protein
VIVLSSLSISAVGEEQILQCLLLTKANENLSSSLGKIFKTDKSTSVGKFFVINKQIKLSITEEKRALLDIF